MEKLLLLFYLVSIDPFEIDQEITNTPEFLERVRRLKENPININTARKVELLLVPYIDDYLAERIVNYREEHPFTRKEELLLIDGITPYLFDRMKNFITVETKRRRKTGGFDFLSRYERKVSSSEDKIYNRIIIPYKGVFLNGLVEKDYEEENYLDYYAFSVYLPEKFIIGDYDLDLGMGVLFGKPDFFYRSAGIIPGEKGPSPHLSTYEENFLRGAVTEWNKLMLFGSYIERSSWGKEKFLGTSYKVSSFRLTGSFSETEERGKNWLGSFYLDKDLAGNLFRFEIASGGYNLSEAKNNISYSAGMDNGRGLKAIYVNIKDSLPTLRNSPFLKDEEAFYLSYTRNISNDLSLGIFSELSREISTLESFKGIAEIQLAWEPLKGLQLQNSMKTQKEQNSDRIDIIHKIRDLTVRSRFEVLNTSEGPGFLTYVGLRYSKNYILEVRLIWYETANWDSRIYEYENDLPGKFTIKQLYGSGKRFYIILGEKILPLEINLKWGIDFKEALSHEIGLAISI
jgi:hypothetical protein